MSEKKKFKINIFDIVIIIVVLIAGGIFYSLNNKEVVQETKPLRYTIEIINQSAGYADNINIGDDIYDNVKNYYMGKVVSVEPAPYIRLIDDMETGVIRESIVEGRENVVIVLEANVTESRSEFRVAGNYVVRAGLEVAIKGNGYAGEGFILTVER